METDICTLAASEEDRACPHPAHEVNGLLRWFELATVLLVAFGPFFLNYFNDSSRLVYLMMRRSSLFSSL